MSEISIKDVVSTKKDKNHKEIRSIAIKEKISAKR